MIYNDRNSPVPQVLSLANNPPDLSEAKKQKSIRVTDSIAKKAMMGLRRCCAIKKYFNRFIQWIRSIPNRITQLFQRQHPQNQKINNPPQFPAPKNPALNNAPVEQSIQNNKNESKNAPKIDRETLNFFIHSLNAEAGILKDEIYNLEFNTLEDFRHIEELKSKIHDKRLFISELEALLKDTKEEKISEKVRKQFDNLHLAFETKLSENQEALETLKEAQDALNQSAEQPNTPDPDINEVYPPRKKRVRRKRMLNQAPKPDNKLHNLLKRDTENQSSLDLIKNLITPPSYENAYNNCWFHASLEILWLWNPHFSNLIKKKVDQINSLNPGVKFNHGYPVDPMILLEALQAFTDAMDSGRIDAVRLAADQMQNAVRILAPNLRDFGRQQDAEEFLQFILSFLTDEIGNDGKVKPKTFFNMETTRQGCGIHKNLTGVFSAPQHILRLEIKDNLNFQNILNDNFAKAEVNDPENPIPIGKSQITHYQEQQKISSQPPEFFFVQMKRFEFPSREEVIHELTRVAVEKKKIIDSAAKSIIAKRKEKKKEMNPDVARVLAEDSLKNRGLLPEFNLQARKKDALIEFPENHKINFAAAFGADSDNPAFTYEMRGAILHHGNSVAAGHYTANVIGTCPEGENVGSDQWFHCNDAGAIVTPQTPQEVKNGEGYVYFFVKVDQSSKE